MLLVLRRLELVEPLVLHHELLLEHLDLRLVGAELALGLKLALELGAATEGLHAAQAEIVTKSKEKAKEEVSLVEAEEACAALREHRGGLECEVAGLRADLQRHQAQQLLRASTLQLCGDGPLKRQLDVHLDPTSAAGHRRWSDPSTGWVMRQGCAEDAAEEQPVRCRGPGRPLGAARRCVVVRDEAEVRSECSAATVSTAASMAPAAPAGEEREVRRLAKKLREIEQLATRAAAGERLDVLQLEKLKQRAEVAVELDTQRGLAAARARRAALAGE